MEPALSIVQPSEEQKPTATSKPARSAKRAVRKPTVPVAAAPVQPVEPGPIKMIEDVIRAGRLPILVGFVWGGLIPFFTFVIDRFELAECGADDSARIRCFVLVAAGLLYSARKVFSFARAIFGDVTSALGFTVLVEGAMVFSSTFWLAVVGVVVLVFTNWISATHRLIKKR